MDMKLPALKTISSLPSLLFFMYALRLDNILFIYRQYRELLKSGP